MNALATIKNIVSNPMSAAVTRTVSTTLLKVNKLSPEILVGAGVVGVVATVVIASKASLNLNKIVDEARYDIEDTKILHENRNSKNENIEYGKDLAYVYAKSGLAVAKLYAPAAVVGVLSISAILGSHGILRARNAGLMAAYKLLDESFKNYRGRVEEKYGESVDRQFAGGIYEEKVIVEDSEGKRLDRTNVTVETSGMSPYARWFDDSSPNWMSVNDYNISFLKGVQNQANDRLHAHGFLFLNDVYKMLGLRPTAAGQVVGWVSGAFAKDDYVEFGIYDPTRQGTRDFINGYEKYILLDFNVDGPILELIDKI